MRTGAGQRGFALIAVVWVIALLSVMALDVLAGARREHGRAFDLAERARLDAAADAGIAVAIHGLLLAEAGAAGQGRRDRPGAPDAAPREVYLDGVRVLVTLEDEAGKIDLNQAPEPVLRALFEALGQPPARAAALAAAVLDWRDGNEVPRPGGAEAPDYRAARAAVPPRDGDFRSIEELIHVRGMTPALLAAAAPALTVHSRSETVDLAVAPPLAARAGATSGRGGGQRSLAAQVASDARGGTDLAGRAFRIRAEAASPAGRRVRNAVVRLTGDPADPYWMQEYR